MMNLPEIPVVRLNPRAKLPVYASPDAAGADLCALLDTPEVTVLPGETVTVHTGLAVAVPVGYAGLIYARSGLSCRRGLAPANKVGVIDADYRGEIMIVLHNHGTAPATIADGERIAQIVVTPCLCPRFTETNTLDGTSRGTGGFGSTGRT